MGGDGEAMLFILIIVIVVAAAVGLFVAIWMFIIFFNATVARHSQILLNRMKAANEGEILNRADCDEELIEEQKREAAKEATAEWADALMPAESYVGAGAGFVVTQPTKELAEEVDVDDEAMSTFLAEKCQPQFDKFDTNNNGVLEGLELKKAVEWAWKHFYPVDDKLTKEQRKKLVRLVMVKFDKNRDWKMDFEEFSTYFRDVFKAITKFRKTGIVPPIIAHCYEPEHPNHPSNITAKGAKSASEEGAISDEEGEASADEGGARKQSTYDGYGADAPAASASANNSEAEEEGEDEEGGEEAAPFAEFDKLGYAVATLEAH